jgi:phasin family protein
MVVSSSRVLRETLAGAHGHEAAPARAQRRTGEVGEAAGRVKRSGGRHRGGLPQGIVVQCSMIPLAARAVDAYLPDCAVQQNPRGVRPMATAKPAMKFPMMFDAETVAAAQKRNVDALTSAAQIMADGMRAYVKRQTEIVEASFKDMMAESEAMLKAKPEAAKPAEALAKVKTFYEKAVANAQELGGIVVKAQTEAVNVLSNAAVANLEDMKKLAA